jgi:hypothetical protein
MTGRATGIAGKRLFAILIGYGSAAVAITTTAHLVTSKFLIVDSWSTLVLAVSIITAVILAVGYFILEPTDITRIAHSIGIRKP